MSLLNTSNPAVFRSNSNSEDSKLNFRTFCLYSTFVLIQRNENRRALQIEKFDGGCRLGSTAVSLYFVLDLTHSTWSASSATLPTGSLRSQR